MFPATICRFRLQGLEEGGDLRKGGEREARTGPLCISSEVPVGEIQDMREGVCPGFPKSAGMSFRGKAVKVFTSLSHCAGGSLASRCDYN